MDFVSQIGVLVPMLTGEMGLAQLTAVRQHESLGPALANHYGHRPDAELLDELGADHYHLFGLEVFPYASVFFNENAHMGGVLPGQVAEFYALRGLERPSEPDHLGRELALLANLVEAGDEKATASFFWRYLMSWYFPFAEAVKALQHPFYNALFDQLESLLAVLGSQLEPIPAQIEEPEAEPLEALDQQETGIGDISEFLLAPRLAGFFLSRTALKEMGERIDMPTGFGTRSTLLPQIFYTAVDYDRLPALLEELDRIAAAQQERYNALAQGWPGMLDYWLGRVAVIRAMLSKMKAAV
ncbi:MAG: molecular chaperone TorD family protein [bacterium]|nr:molecular chaperone TorD family protein [bacterium]